jgi:predicted DNA-binding WGR domain protein
MATASLIFQDEVSNKFWNLETSGKKFTTNWGRIGTFGQSLTKSFYSESECERQACKLIDSKVKKGYVEAISEELITQAFIEILSGIAKRRNGTSEIYYRDDKFNKMATIDFVDGDSSHIIFRHYYENGNKKSEHEWLNNKQDGNDFGWYEDGGKHWERKFTSGKLVYEKRY